jgi:hypothetical protein
VFDGVTQIDGITTSVTGGATLSPSDPADITLSGFVQNPSFEVGSVGNISAFQTLNNWKLGGAQANASGISASILTGNTTWTGTFTPTSNVEDTSNVLTLATSYTDAAGNAPASTSTTAFYEVDTIAPTMTITSSTVDDGSTSNDPAITLIFTSSEATADFTESDVTVTNGTMSNFASVSSTVSTVIFTPSSNGATTVDVAANTFTDPAGNPNTAAGQFNWNYDSTPPTVTITSSTVTSGTTTNDSPIALTFTSSEATTNFVVGDITLSNGTLSNFAGSGTTYTATFTPSSDGATAIAVAAGVYTDAVGNNNTAASQFNWTYDGTSPTLTSVSIASTNSTSTLVKHGEDVVLTFTASETIGTPVVTFLSGGAAITDGLINYSNTSGNTWTATYDVRYSDTEGAVTFSVAFSDTVGNAGTDVTVVTDGTSVTFDKTPPTISEITAITTPTNDNTPNFVLTTKY